MYLMSSSGKMEPKSDHNFGYPYRSYGFTGTAKKMKGLGFRFWGLGKSPLRFG